MNHPICRFFAPGRVELLGNHTDYNDGVVLSAALDLGVWCKGSIRNDPKIFMHSEELNGSIEVDSSAGPVIPNATWADYPLGVWATLRDQGYRVGGVNLSFSSDLPPGAGLSSSAAIEVATASLLDRLFGLSLSPLQMAKLCRKAENDFVGVNCGLLDQATSVFGRRDHLVFLDCREESVNTIQIPAGVVFLIVQSGVKHELTGGEYNERREQCFEAASRLGVSHLRDATSAGVESADLPEMIRHRALHITGENERVLASVHALRAGDLEAFGRLMCQSHESSRLHFENSTPELDLLVGLLCRQPGVYGARLTGGGFGGAVVALVEIPLAEKAALHASLMYREKTGLEAAWHICHAGDGAAVRSASAG